MSKYADLHIHTSYSDSSLSPEEVVEQASRNGLSCISITDHDTIEGVEPALKRAEGLDLEIIPGIELSSEINGRDIHILGYFLRNPGHDFMEKLVSIQDSRIARMKEMIEKLNQVFGIDNITLDEVCDLARSNSVGRPHLALTLKKKGWITTTAKAFSKYIGEGDPAYVAKYKQTPAEAIKLIHDAGGASVFAHPMVTGADEIIPGLVKAGLDGIEVYYCGASKNIIKFYEKIAEKHNLILTGGSDAHGASKTFEQIGMIKMPYDLVEMLKQKINDKA
ncbi:MAG: PHP domain-containing protein [Candidatus Zapsychrus exili]|nr:PHP domain-containing protein [Candidatus Zapsychrus exili]